MKKFLKICGVFILCTAVILYLGFLFIVPNVIDLNKYKTNIQQIAAKEAQLNVNFENLRVYTTPLLKAGVKLDDVSIKMPDETLLFSAKDIKAGISLPSVLLLTVNVNDLVVNDPFVNLEIKENDKFKIMKLVEDIVNTKKEKARENPTVAVQKEAPFDISKIRIRVPSATLNNYRILTTDLKTGHFLELKGEELKAGYFNGKSAKLKTLAHLFSDDKENIVADIKINTFLPKFEPSRDEEDDPAEKLDIPFMNPVEVYRNYDLKLNLDAKCKIREMNDGIVAFGHVNVDDFTLKLSNLQLPTSYFHAKSFGQKIWVDSVVNVTDKDSIVIAGNINHNRHPRINVDVKTGKINFEDLLMLGKATLDSLQIKHELNQYKTKGYFEANANIKTNFKKLRSSGEIVVKEGGLSVRNIPDVVSDANINLLLNDNVLNFQNSSLLLNNEKIEFGGSINEKSYADISIKADKITLSKLFDAFAPKDLRNSYNLTSGTASLNLAFKGLLKEAVANANFAVKDLGLSDKKRTFNISNQNLFAKIKVNKETLDTDIENDNFEFLINGTKSTVKVPKFKTLIDKNNINILENALYFNDNSKILFKGNIDNYAISPVITMNADGNIDTKDLIKLIGQEYSPYFHFTGSLPFKATIDGDKKKQVVFARITANDQNFITPIDFDVLKDQTTALQAVIAIKPNRIKIKKTGVFTLTSHVNDEGETIEHLKEFVELDGTVAGDNINILKVKIPNDLSAKLHVFPNSKLNVEKSYIYAYGKTNEPIVKGDLNIHNISIPELLLNMDNLLVSLKGRKLDYGLKNLVLNGDSDLNLDGSISLEPSKILNIDNFKLFSKNINLDKTLQVVDLAMKYVPKTTSSSKPQTTAAADIPVRVPNGAVQINRIKTGEIKVYNTQSRMDLLNNTLYLSNLRTGIFDGHVSGDIAVNLLTQLINVDLKGNGINVATAMLDAAGMKDMLSGKADFEAKLALSGSTPEEIMKNLKGDVSFGVVDGQFGPFGKIENLIIAENIRESAFFQTALGGIFDSLTKIDTTHFDELNGTVSFEDGICHIKNISSIGNVLCLNIFGDFDLLKNEADMKVRAKMSSVISQLLGPINYINPVNLVNSAASLNFVTAKAFSFFCETLDEESMAQIPSFSNKYVDKASTKFQLVVKGDVAKPLTLVKSFKWITTPIDFEKAVAFMSSIPEPIEGSTANTIEEAIAERQAYEAEQKAHEEEMKTLKYKVRHLFDKDDTNETKVNRKTEKTETEE